MPITRIVDPDQRTHQRDDYLQDITATSLELLAAKPTQETSK